VVWITGRNAIDLSRRTFQIAVLISILPAIFAVLILVFGAQDTGVRSRSKVPVLSMKGMDRRFKLFMFALALFSVGNSSDAFIILLGQNRGLTVLQVMLMMMTFNLVYSILAGPLGALSDKIGRRKLILCGWIAYGLVYLGFAVSRTGWHVWTMFGLYGMYYAATEGSTKAFIADLVSPDQRGKAYGISNAVIGLTAFPASVIAGLLWQGAFGWSGLGPSAPFLFGAGLALLAGILFWKIVPAQRRNFF
jgi:MFS family permease